MSCAKNYNYWIFRKIKPYIGSSVLEIGCGIGNFTEFLTDLEGLTCLDMIEECITRSKLKFHKHNNIKYIHGDFLDKTILSEVSEAGYDTIICLNVLEHIEKDRDALKKMFSLLKKGGNLILIVPALWQIYGSLDQSLGHIKRYNKKPLSQLLACAGFKNTYLEYFNSIGILGWYINGRILKRKEMSLAQALIYDKLFIPVIAKIESFVSPPFGMSLLAISRKE
ncbi:hypothetical protein A3J90_01960 [candidate division WOR-1 bacterium RIFOXYC2_FULL_37_10]|uniref:Methyltransferase type 12 domain-containing protein n=1 Tax=candidate division WOR-1 bacterium RIFOXYB2_FULL_37_13 TaxID=1802579 RepID=A0A1F4SU89_UNCSA|nr:MAG: hypothetical protein A2246_02070 [candidate division WOR-1 bacterium RIFOXYA2_FULL_37_7]OGC24002.1 MAG: hypothetical protein A2310_05610 [candidate division WOR-1 bacterium RIFOXYB2_FULL_37_13]OGC33919.1 MAG: hypothetical protein A3J90_01960 [candidate division WOR-1 bacterium RIFOXYC2_FULL_37_10]